MVQRKHTASHVYYVLCCRGAVTTMTPSITLTEEQIKARSRPDQSITIWSTLALTFGLIFFFLSINFVNVISGISIY